MLVLSRLYPNSLSCSLKLSILKNCGSSLSWYSIACSGGKTSIRMSDKDQRGVSILIHRLSNSLTFINSLAILPNKKNKQKNAEVLEMVMVHLSWASYRLFTRTYNATHSLHSLHFVDSGKAVQPYIQAIYQVLKEEEEEEEKKEWGGKKVEDNTNNNNSKRQIKDTERSNSHVTRNPTLLPWLSIYCRAVHCFPGTPAASRTLLP